MKFNRRSCVLFLIVVSLVAGTALADAAGDAGQPAQGVVAAPQPSIMDNLFIESMLGAEKPPGEHSTLFGTLGANWGIPLTPPDGVAFGLQLAGSAKARDYD